MLRYRAAPPMQARTTAMLVAGALAVALFAVMWLVPVPFGVMRPGPVRDVLGESDGTPLISIEGQETFPTSGSLDLLTVSVSGGPVSTVDLADVISGWWDPTVSVLPEHELFPPEQTEEEADQESAEEMVSSQENATAAAMHELQIDVPTTLTVVGFTEGSKAEGELADGDVITAVGGEDVTDLPELRDVLQQTDAGDRVEVSFTRDGSPATASVETLEGEDGRTLLGVLVDPTYHFPFPVDIKIENIGGPSAGMIFSLGIIDKLTPGEMTGGKAIAGTGTIDSAGDVSGIGGIQQKLVGADRAGAEWFLAPADNCAEVVGHVPDGLRVVKVATLNEARAAVEAIGAGQGTAQLPSCG
jgi:PDZ domain-containing protein